MMPSRQEAAELVPSPGGAVWKIAGDARLFAASGYALLLQVMHPTVGAGVTEHSAFKRDPWSRLIRTIDYTSAMTYGGPEVGWEVGRRMHRMHEQISGVRPDGERYSALDPGPYAWVHATLADSIIRGHLLFCGPLSDRETEEFWREWRRMGALIGVEGGKLPETFAGLGTYVDETVAGELVDTEAAQDVLAALRDPAAPPLPAMRGPIWRALRWPPTRVGWLTTLGMLPPLLRERLGLTWRTDMELRFRMVARISRASHPLMPPQARNFGQHYLRWRREGRPYALLR
jgi:uncharacterized protein (DUF2236 family)